MVEAGLDPDQWIEFLDGEELLFTSQWATGPLTRQILGAGIVSGSSSTAHQYREDLRTPYDQRVWDEGFKAGEILRELFQ